MVLSVPLYIYRTRLEGQGFPSSISLKLSESHLLRNDSCTFQEFPVNRTSYTKRNVHTYKQDEFQLPQLVLLQNRSAFCKGFSTSAGNNHIRQESQSGNQPKTLFGGSQNSCEDESIHQLPSHPNIQTTITSPFCLFLKKTKKTPKKRKEKRTLVLHRVPTIELSRPALQVHLRCHLFSHREEQVKGVFSQGFSHNLYIFSRCFLNMLEAKYVLLMYYWWIPR